jgi:hypothetical protein
MLHYCRSAEFGYIRILELEDVRRRTLTGALDKIARDFDALKGFIIDIRDNPGARTVLRLRSSTDFAIGSEWPFAARRRSARAKATLRL